MNTVRAESESAYERLRADMAKRETCMLPAIAAMTGLGIAILGVMIRWRPGRAAAAAVRPAPGSHPRPEVRAVIRIRLLLRRQKRLQLMLQFRKIILN